MPAEKIEIQKLAVFSCKKTEEIFERKRILTLGELRGINEKLEDVFKKNIMGKGRFRGVWNSVPGENTRIHNFSDQSALNNFRGLLDNTQDFEERSTELARRYYGVERSQGAAIFIFTIRIPPHSYAVVYSSEYLGEVVRFSDEELLEDLKDVFSRGLKKGIIYPYEAGGIIHDDKVKIYQKGGRYADYWWKAFGLREEPSNKEILIGIFKKRESERGEDILFDEKYVRELIRINSDAAASEIALVCDGVKTFTKLNKLYRSVIPAEKDGEERIVIIGGDVFIEISKDEFRKFHPERGYKRYNEIE